jgi:chemotaxis protein CheD
MHKRQAALEIFLQPGEYFVSGGDTRIRTLLGSCVSVTIWHPERRVGAMSHFLLSERARRHTDGEPDGRYADEGMMLMIRDLSKLDVPVAGCVAKLFGGGDMFPTTSSAGSVGRKNVTAARHMLAALDIPIVSSCVFGTGHRFIIFDIPSGDVWSRLTTVEPGHVRRVAHAGAHA